MMHVIEKFEHLRIPLKDLKLATNNFADRNYIGRGGFGQVYSGELLLSGKHTRVAIKRLDPRFGQGNPEFWKEIIILSLYKHENIVSLLGFCDESGEKILVYEYASKGSLDKYLNNNDLKWIQRLKICIGAARGLAYLHDPSETHQRVLHRDVKSANILLDENWNARISDFGLSKFGPANQQYTFLMSSPLGTIGYCDPVYAETGLLTKESDVYSFGIVLFEVLCGRLSIGNTLIELVAKYYEEDKMHKLLHASIKDEITYPCFQEFTTIAYKCLSKDPKKRPLMTKVLSKLERALQYQYTTSYYWKDSGEETKLVVEGTSENCHKGWQEASAPVEKAELLIDATGDNDHMGWQEAPAVTEKAELLIEATGNNGHMGWQEASSVAKNIELLAESVELLADAIGNDRKTSWRAKAAAAKVVAAEKIKEAVVEGKEEVLELVEELEDALDKAEIATTEKIKEVVAKVEASELMEELEDKLDKAKGVFKKWWDKL